MQSVNKEIIRDHRNNQRYHTSINLPPFWINIKIFFTHLLSNSSQFNSIDFFLFLLPFIKINVCLKHALFNIKIILFIKILLL
jgi:hypothetical protein